MGELLRRAVFSYSLASLFLLRSYDQFPFFRPAHEAYWRLYPATPMYATLLLVALLAAVIFGIVQWVAGWEGRHLKARRLVDGLLVAFMIIPAYHIKFLLIQPKVSDLTDTILWTVMRLVIVACAIAVAFWETRWPYRVFVASILVVSLLYPISLVRAAMWRPVAPPPPTAPLQSGGLPQRVVWLVFDEADAHSLERAGTPADLALPEFDRLRNESLHAKDAYPAAGATIISIPAMLSGRRVSDLRIRGVATLSLRWEGLQNWESFGDHWTVFRDVRKLGGNSGIVGWFHPYCRLFASEVADCYFEPFNTVREPGEGGASIWEHMRRDLVWAAKGIPLLGRSGLLPAALEDELNRFHAQRLENILQRVERQLTDVKLNFVFAHLPVPHTPIIYDRHKRSYSPDGSYYDNLVLADKVLGRLRRAMEKAGVWDSTTLVLTGDHSWRAPIGREQDPRVPLLIKFPKPMGAAAEYSAPVSTLVLRELTLELFHGRIRSVEQAAGWLQRQRVEIEKDKLLGKNVDFRRFEP